MPARMRAGLPSWRPGEQHRDDLVRCGHTGEVADRPLYRDKDRDAGTPELAGGRAARNGEDRNDTPGSQGNIAPGRGGRVRVGCRPDAILVPVVDHRRLDQAYSIPDLIRGD